MEGDPGRSREAAAVPALREHQHLRSQHRARARARPAPPRDVGREGAARPGAGARGVGFLSVTASSPWPEWIDVCAVDDITPDTGVAALIGNLQIAIVRVRTDQIFAVGNYDPFSRAFVIARGIVGDRAGVPKIASPIFKQSFDLRTGQCLDDPAVRLASYPLRVVAGRILLARPGEEPAAQL